MKYLLGIIVLTCYTISPVFGEGVGKIALQKEITWDRILTSSGKVFVAGYCKKKVHLCDVEKGIKISIARENKHRIINITDKMIYVGTVETKKTKNKILVYNYKGKLQKKIKVNNSDHVLEYFFCHNLNKINFLAIKLDEFLSGKSNGILRGGIYNINDPVPLIKFENQIFTEGRIPMPVAFSYDDILVGIDQDYKIKNYSDGGKFLKEFTKDGFVSLPYTSEEIKYLHPLKQIGIVAGKTFPPIINKIKKDINGTVYIVNYKRPGATELKIDVFTADYIFKKEINLKFAKFEKLKDIMFCENGKCLCLLVNHKTRKFYFKIFRIK